MYAVVVHGQASCQLQPQAIRPGVHLEMMRRVTQYIIHKVGTHTAIVINFQNRFSEIKNRILASLTPSFVLRSWIPEHYRMIVRHLIRCEFRIGDEATLDEAKKEVGATDRGKRERGRVKRG